jgi:hypothetical protein
MCEDSRAAASVAAVVGSVLLIMSGLLFVVLVVPEMRRAGYKEASCLVDKVDHQADYVKAPFACEGCTDYFPLEQAKDHACTAMETEGLMRSPIVCYDALKRGIPLKNATEQRLCPPMHERCSNGADCCAQSTCCTGKRCNPHYVDGKLVYECCDAGGEVLKCCSRAPYGQRECRLNFPSLSKLTVSFTFMDNHAQQRHGSTVLVDKGDSASSKLDDVMAQAARFQEYADKQWPMTCYYNPNKPSTLVLSIEYTWSYIIATSIIGGLAVLLCCVGACMWGSACLCGLAWYVCTCQCCNSRRRAWHVQERLDGYGACPDGDTLDHPSAPPVG